MQNYDKLLSLSKDLCLANYHGDKDRVSELVKAIKAEIQLPKGNDYVYELVLNRKTHNVQSEHASINLLGIFEGDFGEQELSSDNVRLFKFSNIVLTLVVRGK